MKFVFITRHRDNLYSLTNDFSILDEFDFQLTNTETSEVITFALFKVNEFTYILKQKDYAVYKDIWNEKAFEELCKKLESIFKDNEIIMAIHWGAESENICREEVKKYVDDNYIVRGTTKYCLTYYSDHIDPSAFKQNKPNWRMLKNVVRQRVKKAILMRIKNNIISIFLPLVIDIQGIHDVSDPLFKIPDDFNSSNKEYIRNYFEEVLDSYEDESLDGTICIFKDNIEEIKKIEKRISLIEDFIKLKQLIEEIKILKTEKKPLNQDSVHYNKFIEKYVNTTGVYKDSVFLPEWIEKVTKTLDKLIEEAE